jgi:hypothetical protein
VWLHLASTLYLTGLIWCIQVVHYPLMSEVATDRFSAFHRRHSTRIGAVVVLPMIVELLSALVIAVPGAVAAPRWMTLVGLALVLIIWLSTFGLQVPLHGWLAEGFDTEAHESLVRSNWIRTAAWTARAFLVIILTSAAT